MLFFRCVCLPNIFTPTQTDPQYSFFKTLINHGMLTLYSQLARQPVKDQLETCSVLSSLHVTILPIPRNLRVVVSHTHFNDTQLVVTVELKNDISIRGTLKSVDQYLNIKLDDITVLEELKYPHLSSVKNIFIRYVCQHHSTLLLGPRTHNS